MEKPVLTSEMNCTLLQLVGSTFVTGPSSEFLSTFSQAPGSYLTRARILKHLLEAGKSTFRNELSFQRSESTTGYVQASVFVK